jgi:hypothetical protein
LHPLLDLAKDTLLKLIATGAPGAQFQMLLNQFCLLRRQFAIQKVVQALKHLLTRKSVYSLQRIAPSPRFRPLQLANIL